MIVKSDLAVSDADDRLVALWLHGRSKGTQRAYAAEIRRFRAFTPMHLAELTLGEVQDYARDLESRGLAPSTQSRALASVKSLLSFGARLGLLKVDVGRPLRLPKVENRLAERILSEDQVQSLLQAATSPRDRVLLFVLYYGGLRVSEATALRWRNAQPRTVRGEATGQLSVWGKGGKSRTVLLPRAVWNDLQSLRGSNSPPLPVFVSRKGSALSSSQAWRIVKAAAERAGLDPAVSCHWLRHACASHSLHNGATIDLVATYLGHSSIAITSKYLHALPDSSAGLFLPPVSL